MAKAFNREVFETMPVPAAVRQFVIPALASTLITIIYSLADTIFVGMMKDPNQVAGLTVAFPYYQFLNAFSSLWGIGANSVMSRALGEKRFDRVSKASCFGFWCSAVFMLCICALFACLQRPLLMATGASSNTYAHASGYLLWTFLVGGIPTVLSIVLSNLLRAEGHAKQASSGLMLGGLLNCVLDPVFIFPLHMGVIGAGIATMLSNIVCLVYLLLVYAKLRATSYITLKPFAYRIEWPIVGKMVLVGLPSCCLTLLGATGCIIQTALYSSYSDIAVAAWGVVNRISFIGIYATHGVAQGVLPLIGYNFGAKNFQRVRAVNRHAFAILMIIAFALLALSEIFSAGIVRVFINDAETIRVGTSLMRCYMLCTPFMSTILLVSTLCQAVGKWQYSLIMLSIRQLVFNIPLMLLLNRMIGILGVALGQPTCDFICLFLAIFVYRFCFVRKMRPDGPVST